jgi:hypothetical protein
MKTFTNILTSIATLALPVLALADDKPLPPDQGVAACVEFREKAVACKEVLADYFASFAPPERRARIREKALAEIIADGSGPLEARRAKCAESQAAAPYTEADVATLRACAAKTDCDAQLACAKPVMQKLTGTRRKH